MGSFDQCVCVCMYICVCFVQLRIRGGTARPKKGTKRVTTFDAPYVGLAITIHTYVYTVYIQYFWQGNYRTYGYIRCTYTVLTKPVPTVHAP